MTQPTPTSAKRRSGHLDFSSLGPLRSKGTVGFTSFRDQHSEQARRRKARKKGSNFETTTSNDSEDDEDETGILGKMIDVDDRDEVAPASALEDVESQVELADGLGRIRVRLSHWSASITVLNKEYGCSADSDGLPHSRNEHTLLKSMLQRNIQKQR